MRVSGKHKIVLSCALSAWILVSSGCSNPLSHSAAPLQNFHSKNTSCNQVDFSVDRVTVDQMRAIVHCVNSHHEIEAFEVAVDQMSDESLAPFAELLNQTKDQRPSTLFVLREIFKHAETTGDLAQVEDLAVQMLASPAMNQKMSALLQKNIPAIAQFTFDSSVQFDSAGIYALTHAQAYQRFGNEILSQDALTTFVQASSQYVKSRDAISLPDLYQLLDSHQMGAQFKRLTRNNEKASLQNLAHFFEWLFSGEHYQILSDGARQSLQQEVKCFKGKQTIPNPLHTVLSELSSRSPPEAARYLSHDLKNLYLVSQGYCEFPYGFSALLHLAEEATLVPGFAEMMTLAQPLFKDQKFLDLISSQASAQFVKSLNPLVEKHFFEDLFTLALINTESSITNNGLSLAKLLQNLVQNASSEDSRNLVEFFKPFFNADELYGAKLAKIFLQMGFDFPTVNFAIQAPLQQKLQQSLETFVLTQHFEGLFDLTKNLLVSKTLNGLVDQSLEYFHTLFETGKIEITHRPVVEPKITSLPISKWQIAKFEAPARSQQSVCESLALDWNFSRYSSAQSLTYLKQMDAILTCVNPNQTFRSAKDLVSYSISRGHFPYILSTQNDVVSAMFNLDRDLGFHTFQDFLAVRSKDSNTIRQIFLSSSEAVKLTQVALMPKTKLRSMLGQTVSEAQTYAGLSELLKDTPARSRSSRPTLELAKLSSVNVIVSKTERYQNLGIRNALAALFREYCPSFDDSSRDCGIESDQLALYLRSPEQLYQSIVSEYVNSDQSWLHPTLSQGLTHQNGVPTQVSELEYHLNPALHLLRNAPQAPRSILNAVTRFKQDRFTIGKFVSERAVKITLIPYVFQLPWYPGSSRREYHDRIRLRLVSDLDRLELIAINADFKAFNLVSNMGMGFIRDLGLAWGDVPSRLRPASLNQFRDSSEVQTLSETRDVIEAQLAKYDTNLLQKLGACDPRGHGLFRRFIANHLCNAEIFDISSRIFNLRFLIPLLTDELPVKDGGDGGLEFLRDLFYSLYEGNSNAQRDVFSDGVAVSQNCLENPLDFSNTPSDCRTDQLTLISKITHMGLLHQAALSVIQAQDHPIGAMGGLLEKLSASPQLSEAFVQTLTQDKALLFLKDAVDYGFQAPSAASSGLSQLVQISSAVSDTQWMKLGLEAMVKYPHLPRDHKALLNSLLSMDTQGLKPWTDFWMTHPQSSSLLTFNALSKKLDPSVRSEMIQLLIDLAPNSGALAKTTARFRALPELETARLKEDMKSWFNVLQKDQSSSTRQAAGAWVSKPEFVEFGQVFSDSAWVDKAYNFLESVNQNPDSKVFLQACQDFLNAH